MTGEARVASDFSAPEPDDEPLFILGCVRSGTTLTRDLLRQVPNVICPEETHFFRWTEPFRSPSGTRPYRGNKVLIHHREIDAVEETSYLSLLEDSCSKAELQRRYVHAFATAKGLSEPYRWFDKTPQNIQGAALIAQEFPRATFLHLVRNPLNVVASLSAGRQIKIPDIHGACNVWLEAIQISKTLRAAFPERVLQVRYEDLVTDVPKTMEKILSFAGFDADATAFSKADARRERNLWVQDLTEDEAQVVVERCGRLALEQGYDIAAEVAARNET